MALSAFSTSNAKREAVEAYVDGITTVSDSWRNVVEYRTDDAPALRLSSMAAIGEVAAWNGTADLSSTATSAGSASTKTITVSQYGSQVTISRLDAADIPGLVQGMARRMGTAVANTYAKQVFTALEGGLTGGTVTSGPTVGGVTKTLFAADHFILQPPSGTPDRSNYLTTALDPGGLAAAIKAARQWVDQTNAPYDFATLGGFWLVVPPDLEEAAIQMIASPYTLTSITTTGTGGQSAAAPSQGLSNMVQQFMTTSDIIVSPHLTDANAWYLLPKMEAPLVAWQRLSPVLRQAEDEDVLSVKLTVDFALAVDAQPEPIGIGSNPS